MDIDLKKLKAPFRNISWRIGSKSTDKKTATFLAYVDARDIMDRLDDVVGIENWKIEYEKVECKNSIIDYRNEKYKSIIKEWDKENRKYIFKEEDDIKKVIHTINDETFIIMQAKLSIKIGDEWVTKVDGTGTRDTETEKSLMSDAFKRVAVLFGIARYLYDVKTGYIPIDSYGKTTSEGQKKLEKCLKDAEKGIYENIIDKDESLNETEKPTNKTEHKSLVENISQKSEMSLREQIKLGEFEVDKDFDQENKIRGIIKFKNGIKRYAKYKPEYQNYSSNIGTLETQVWINFKEITKESIMEAVKK